MKELISVVIPVYKVEAYLPACVESVLAQTWQDFEIILVDDGSPDRSGQICDEYAARDSRIRVIHKENGGVALARNIGIAQARGKYFAFLDSDDVWSPMFLERLYQAILETDADFAVCPFQRFSGAPSTVLPEKATTICMTQREAFELLFNAYNIQMVAPPNKLYKRALFHDITYPVGLIHEDEAVIHEIIGAADRIAWVQEAHYNYRETSNSIMTTQFHLKRLDETYAKEQRIAYFEHRGMQDLADRTKIVYLRNLMRLHRTVQECLEDKAAAKEACGKLHTRFCELCTPELIRKQSTITKVRYVLFRRIPRLYSKVEFYRLKRKGVI
jgi:glycosyltransferase involved in cell wall biosynthesis